MTKKMIVIIVTLCFFTLSLHAVEEPVYLPNYGLAYYRTNSSLFFTNLNMPASIYLGQQNATVRSFPGFYYELDHEENTTYHVKLWYNVSNISSSTLQSFFKSDIIQFAWFVDDDISYAENITNSFGGEYKNFITSTLTIEDQIVTYDIYYNTSSGNLDNIPFGLAYFAIAFDSAVHPSTNYYVTFQHAQVEAWYDREAEIYEEILDQIAANQEVIIDRQGTIINYGSGNQPPSGGSQLSQAESQLSSAEEAVLNKSSDLKESVADDWNNQKSDARDFVNTITPSTQVFLTVYNDFVSVLPDNVKILFVVLPLLIFIGWLVGRIN